MAKKHRYLGDILTGQGLIDEKKLNRALGEQKNSGEPLGRILLKNGAISVDDLYKSLAVQFDMAVVKLSDYQIDKKIIDNIPATLARKHRILPVKMNNNTLTVAMADPLSFPVLSNLQAMLDYRVEGVLATEDEISRALDQYYGTGEESIETIISEMSERDIAFVGVEKDKAGEEELEDEAPVIKLVSLLILEAFRSRASDIHLEPLPNRFRVRYRVDGVCYEVPAPPKRLQGSVLSRVKIMAGINIAEKRLPQDGRIKLNLLGKEVDLRVSTLPTLHGESVVLRILDKSSLLLDLGDMGFLPEDKERFEDLLNLPNGIILVTGPTGSGKTTTLYACLNKINQPDKKLISVEEPVEYQLSGINQTQVRPAIGLTFARVLREILRQSPNIIMVGEIRDRETAEIAIRAALTGHLVFSTLHTNDAPSAMTRLIDMGIKPFLVSSSIQGIMAQRLVRVICPTCKEPYQPSSEELFEIGLSLEDTTGLKFYRGKGCRECNQVGYRGRQGIFEVLMVTDPIRNLVLNRASSSEIREKARSLGMRTLREDGWQKVFKGITTVAEVVRVTQMDVE
ncbi:type II secretion system ATPase GspE [candidate division NPL-UPA2 bacterium]|nr:type II secretion system ATPase GspE [candidate division NPL-UPA2 bacterium]